MPKHKIGDPLFSSSTGFGIITGKVPYKNNIDFDYHIEWLDKTKASPGSEKLNYSDFIVTVFKENLQTVFESKNE